MHILIYGNDDGAAIRPLAPSELMSLLADPEAYASITSFRSPGDFEVDPDPNYWPDGEAVLLEATVVVPERASAWVLPS